MSPLQFTRNVRSLNRLRRIARVLTKHGFGYIVAQMNLARFVPVRLLSRRAAGRSLDEGASGIGRRLAAVCSDLGPTFIKLGQLLSTRPDIVPPEVLAELRTLQDDVPPFDPSVAMEVIAAQVDHSSGPVFDWIDETPLASGSIGQVHRARDKDGVELVVKVRRPGIEEVIKLDMQLLRWLAESLERVMPELRIYRPKMIVEELEETLERELDYVNEASITARFRKAFENDDTIHIPRVYWRYTGPRVLTLEALTGTNVERLLAETNGEGPSVDRSLVARRLADCYLRQIFEMGLFHADPHPGNILVEPPARVGLVDFGQVGIITEEWMTQLIVIVHACVDGEVEIVIDALADMRALGSETDRVGLARSLQALVGKYHGLPLKRLDLGTMAVEFSNLIRRHDVVVPRDMLLLIKTLGTVASVTARLDPELDLLELLQPRLKRAMSDQFSPGRLTRGASLAGWHLFSILRQAPRQLRHFLQRISSGDWQLQIRHENIERLTRELDRASNRLAFSIVIAAIIVGSSVVLSADQALTVFGIKIQHFGMLGYLIAGVLGVGLSWAIFRSGRLH